MVLFLLKVVSINLLNEKNIRNLNNYDSEIYLIIHGNGTQNILNDTFDIEPSEVFVNGNKNNFCKKDLLFNRIQK